MVVVVVVVVLINLEHGFDTSDDAISIDLCPSHELGGFTRAGYTWNGKGLDFGSETVFTNNFGDSGMKATLKLK